MKKILFLSIVVSLLCLSSCGAKEKTDQPESTSMPPKSYLIYWENEDGTLLDAEKYQYGETPTYKGETPTKEADVQYVYAFNGWEPEIQPVTKSLTYTACYANTLQKYTVTWKNYDGTILSEEDYDYGVTPTYKGNTPVREGDDQYSYYFGAWEPTPLPVKGNIEYTASFYRSVNQYTVTWKNYDGTILNEETYEYGATPKYKKETPTREKDEDCYYVFAGWDRNTVVVTGNTSYTATYDRAYQIIWENYDGEKLKTEIVVENQMPIFDQDTPVRKDPKGTYAYTFKGWDKAIEPATKNITYTAQYTKSLGYNLIFNGTDGYVVNSCLLTDADYLEMPAEYEGYPVVEIGSRAFAALPNVENIVIPSSIRRIGTSAFENCTSLKTLYIPSTVGRIDASILKGCNSLESLTVPFIGSGNLNYSQISYWFGGASDNSDVPTTLKTLAILEGCKGIGKNALRNCSFETISIPHSVTTIGDYALNMWPTPVITIYGASATLGENVFHDDTVVNYYGSLAEWLAISGKENISNVYFNIYINGEDALTNIIIPHDMTEIPAGAFSNCHNITSITIPDTITSIGDGAFKNCSSLKEIIIPDSVVSIGKGILAGCTSIEKMTLPFVGPNKETTKALSYFFDNLIPSTLKDIVISDACTSLCNYVFSGTNLESLTLPRCLGTSIGYLFIYASSSSGANSSLPTSLTNVYFTETCTNISVNYFINAKAPLTVHVPHTVASFSKDAFKDCEAKLEYHGTIGEWLNIDVADSYLIDTHLYSNDEEITSVTIPSNVSSLRPYAFCGCSSILSIIISSTVSSIGKDAFKNCDATIAYHGTIASWMENILKVGDSSTVYLYLGADGEETTSIVIPEGTTSIPDYSFHNCRNIKSIVVPSSVTSIGAYAFIGCDSLETIVTTDSVPLQSYVDIRTLKNIYYHGSTENFLNFNYKSYINNDVAFHLFLDGSEEETTSFTFSEDTTEIKSNALYNCVNLKTIVVPNTVTKINEGAFSGCSSLENITLPFVGKNPNARTGIVLETEGIDSMFCYIFGKRAYEGASNIDYHNWSSDSAAGIYYYYVPNSLKNVTITNIWHLQKNAFSSCNMIKTVTLPEGCKYIDNYAFNGCSSLETVSIPESVTWLGVCTFRSCKSLKNVNIPSAVTSIGRRSFSGCTSLETLTLPEGIQTIEDEMFFACAFVSFTVPNSVATIGHYAFRKCKLLKTIILSEGLTSIGNYAFEYCYALEAPAWPNSLYKIGDYAFSSCKFAEITIPGSIRSIGTGAFSEYGAGSVDTDFNYTGSASNWMSLSGKGALKGRVHFFLNNSEQETTDFVIPKNTTSIGEHCFDYCRSLTSVLIPTSVNSIGRYSFRSSISIIYYEGTEYQYSTVEIDEYSNLEESHVYFYSSNQPTQAGRYWRYVNGVPTVWE